MVKAVVVCHPAAGIAPEDVEKVVPGTVIRMGDCGHEVLLSPSSQVLVYDPDYDCYVKCADCIDEKDTSPTTEHYIAPGGEREYAMVCLKNPKIWEDFKKHAPMDTVAAVASEMARILVEGWDDSSQEEG